jgi:hypothetical protein
MYIQVALVLHLFYVFFCCNGPCQFSALLNLHLLIFSLLHSFLIYTLSFLV